MPHSLERDAFVWFIVLILVLAFNRRITKPAKVEAAEVKGNRFSPRENVVGELKWWQSPSCSSILTGSLCVPVIASPFLSVWLLCLSPPWTVQPLSSVLASVLQDKTHPTVPEGPGPSWPTSPCPDGKDVTFTAHFSWMDSQIPFFSCLCFLSSLYLCWWWMRGMRFVRRMGVGGWEGGRGVFMSCRDMISGVLECVCMCVCEHKYQMLL